MISICRLCAKEKEPNEFVSDINNLKELLLKMFLWQKSENENQLPQSVCGSCVDRLQSCWDFIKNIHEAEKKLNEMIEKRLGTASTSVEIFYCDGENLEGDTDIVKSEYNYGIPEAQSGDENKGNNDDDSDQETSEMRLSQDGFLHRLHRKYCLVDGSISDAGLTKLVQKFPLMKTFLWDDCEYKCDKCPEIIKGSNHFFQHFKSLHYADQASYRIICFYCNYVQKSLFQLNQHIASSHYIHLKYRCTSSSCSKFYWNLIKLGKHRSSHPRAKFTCLLCGRCGMSKYNLKSHLLVAHLMKDYPERFEEKYICEYCNQEFNAKDRIRSHMMIHREKLSFVCHLCGVGFKAKGNLLVHLSTVHNDRRQFKCTQCGRDYKTKYRLTQHLKTHKPSQCLPCSVCNKEFSTQIKLNTHMKIHEEVGTYSCTFCDKTFHYSGQLQNHERTHTGVKPHACPLCDFKSTTSTNLNRHAMRKHSLDLRKSSKTPQ